MKTSIISEVVTPRYGARDKASNPQSTYIEIIERPLVATLSRLKEMNSVVARSRSSHIEAIHGM
jgi:hypothetical protein